MELMQYSLLYYPAAIYGLIISVIIRAYSKQISYGVKILFTAPILVVYMLGMTRTKGIDIGIYLRNFNGELNTIYDKGYVLLSDLFNLLNLPFKSLLFLFGVLSVYTIYKLSKRYSLDFMPLFVIYFVHFIVGTDFSQFRVGAASSIAAIAFINKSFLRWVLYALAISVHLSAIFFVLISEYSKFLLSLKNSKLRISMFFASFILLILIGNNLGLFALIDERVSIYIETFSEYEGYGAPVSNYYQPFFFSLVFLPFIVLYKYVSHSRDIKVLALIHLYGIGTFFAFSDYSIFAHRLTSLTVFLYPVFLLHTLNLASKTNYHLKKFFNLYFIFIFLGFFTILIYRPAAIRVIDTIYI